LTVAQATVKFTKSLQPHGGGIPPGGIDSKASRFWRSTPGYLFSGFVVVSPRWGFKKEDDLLPMVNTIGNDLSLRCSFLKDEP
jgi:hypothetical protein